MKLFSGIFTALTIVLIATSCAKKESDGVYDIETRSFEAWMEQYYPDAEPQGNGLYMKWITRNSSGTSVGEYGSWVQVSYTGKTLVEGNIFKTRYEDIAKREDSFTLKTNYVPELLFSGYNDLTYGENYAVANMREGEKAVVYMPSRLGYKGSAQNFTNGYGGHTSLPAGMIPLAIEVELVKVIADTEAREKELVNAYAKSDEGGMSDDDIMENSDEKVYAKVISKKTSTGLDEEDEDPYSEILGTDEVYFYVKTSVIQEGGTFMVDTNIDSLANYYWKDFAPNIEKSMTFNHSASAYMKAYKTAFDNLHLTWQSHFRIITMSAYAYGSEGNKNLSLKEPYGVIQPYTPLVIDIYIQPKDWEPGDEPATDYGQDD